MAWDKVSVRGEDLYVHQNELFSNHIKRTGDYYEPEILDYLQFYYPQHRTIIDIGANIGNHTMFFARHFTFNTIYAIEPVYENYTLLINNLNLLDSYSRDKVVALPFALSDERKDGYIHLNFSNMGAGEAEFPDESLVYGRGDFQKTSFYPLDHFGFDTVTLLKIDAEWHEPQILAGAKNTISKWNPLILVEDTQSKYKELFPDYYRVIQAWPEHSTYLYGV